MATPRGKAIITYRSGDKFLGQSEVGATIFSPNIPTLMTRLDDAKKLGLQSLLFTDLTGTMDNAMAATLNNFATPIGAKLTVYVPVRHDNYLDYAKWAVAQLNPEALQGDAERMGISDQVYLDRFGILQDEYSDRTCILNTGLLTRDDTETKVLNSLIKAQPISYYAGKQYQHLSSGCVWGADQVKNLAAINNYYSTYLPGIQAKKVSLLPNVKRQFSAQWNEYEGASFLSPANLNFAIGKHGLFILKNTADYSHLYRQSITTLIDRNGPTPEYDAMQRIIPGFKFKWIVPVDITLDGCEALGFWDGVDNFGLLTINQASVDHSVAANQIKIHGNVLSATTFSTNSGSADSLTSSIVNRNENLPTITIYKNCVGFTKFQIIAA